MFFSMTEIKFKDLKYIKSSQYEGKLLRSLNCENRNLNQSFQIVKSEFNVCFEQFYFLIILIEVQILSTLLLVL